MPKKSIDIPTTARRPPVIHARPTSGRLYETGLDLRICADAWEPDARLIGNIRAGDLAEMARDYARLRLQAGISNSESALPRDAWRPIASAPLDGSHVDLWVEPGSRLADCWWNAERAAWQRWDVDPFSGPGIVNVLHTATHWRPIVGPGQ